MNDITEELLTQIHHRYLAQRERILLPKKQIGGRENETRLRASRLYGCSIADYYARSGKEHTHPHTYSLLQRFEQGNRVAESWQEALVWASSLPEYSWLQVDYEVSLESESLVGQADLVVNGIPIEIKNTIRRQPFGGHMLQLMAYCKLLDAPYGVLVYQREFDNQLYRVNADHAVVEASMAAMAEYAPPPHDIYEIRPGQCTVETSVEEIFPRVAQRGSTRSGVQKGDVVPGKLTVKCQYFGHCFPWSQGHAKFKVHGTNESLALGKVTAITPDEP